MPANIARDIIWISGAPFASKGDYPLLLDYAEAACLASPNPLLSGVAGSLAPTWEELDAAGVTRAGPSAAVEQEISERAEFMVHLRFIVGALARALTEAGAGIGLLFRLPRRSDADGLIFIERALRQAALVGMPVSMLGRRDRAIAVRMRSLHPDIAWRTAAPVHSTEPDFGHPATRLLGVCPQGVPLTVLSSAASMPHAPGSWVVEPAGGGRIWARLSHAHRRRVLATMPDAEQRLAHARLFQAWPPAGWDYLRRAVHAWQSHDPALIGGQAAAIAYATRSLGAEFAAQHIKALASCARDMGLPPTGEARLSANMARLMPDTRDGTPARGAVPHLRQALRQCVDPGEKIEHLYDLANHYARSRRPTDLARARRYYATAFPLLPSEADEEARIRKEIRLLNGLALVAYHERNDAEALELEQRAHVLAGTAALQYPAVAEWARPLLNTNTAKLLIHRFANSAQAAGYLHDSASSPDGRVRRKATLDLARLAFDNGDAARVVQLLSSVYEMTLPDENEADEAIGRAIFAIANLALGRIDAAADAIARVDYISRVLGLPGGHEVVTAVRMRIASTSLAPPNAT